MAEIRNMRILLRFSHKVKNVMVGRCFGSHDGIFEFLVDDERVKMDVGGKS